MENITEIELYKKVNEVTVRNKYWQGIPVNLRDDLLVDVYEKALIALRDGKIEGEWDDVKNYVFIVGLNACKEAFRKLELKNKAFTIPRDIYNEIIPLEQLYVNDELEIESDLIAEVNTIINAMGNPITRDIFNLVLEGYKMREIAEKLDIPLDMAKGYYQRGVTKIRKNNKARITTRRRKKVKEIQYRRIIRKVINTDTGDIYDNVAQAARENDIKYGTLNHYLNGTRTNKSKLEYYDPSNDKKTEE